MPPGPGDVQIAVAFTGICGTDLHIRHGSMDARVRVPVVLGHEMSGRIAAVGAAVSRWRVGDPVTVMPLRWCDSCPAYDRSDFERAVRLIAEGTVPAGRLVSRVEPLGSAAEAFTALESGDGVMKVLVDCRGEEG